jgi:SagB-type dehydrogenase family enzyme
MRSPKIPKYVNYYDDYSVTIDLPKPTNEGGMSVEEAILNRASVREFSDECLPLSDLSQLLWAAQGITREEGYRTTPSAGALYPIEIYIVTDNVCDLSKGVYKYNTYEHNLAVVAEGEIQQSLAEVSLRQDAVSNGAAVLVITGVYERTTGKYGDRGIRYVHIEVGNVSQNIYLQATSLDIGTVFIGAFDDENIKTLLKMRPNEQPLGIMPVGKK